MKKKKHATRAQKLINAAGPKIDKHIMKIIYF